MMDAREIDRIKHYCKRLKLNSWDIKDITSYIVLHEQYSNEIANDLYYNSTTEKFNLIRAKINQLELDNIVNEFEKYLKLELILYDEIRLKDNTLSDSEIWYKVSTKIDGIIDEEIFRAKEISKEVRANKGCVIMILVIISATILAAYAFI